MKNTEHLTEMAQTLNSLAQQLNEDIDLFLSKELERKKTFAKISKDLTMQKYEYDPIKRGIIDLALVKLSKIAYGQKFTPQ
ncbi:hypothetical protein [Vagococcus salmoninarum]|uniref:hypothetical protein n=1 Tax=Vagococcus salmoninarum TaxID=2739 RepID=UPI00187FFFB7|nr:hypothetical protein [Vagococcus salmoninarum]MBE9387871.1 hypothetical protein [Vagococcus salmoninarum]